MCQKWSAQTPHTHNIPLNPNNGIGDHNFCRSLVEGEEIWCFIDDAKFGWKKNDCSSLPGNRISYFFLYTLVK